MNGRRVVITGGSKGLGRALALRLARAGADLVLAALDPEALEEAGRAVRDAGGREPLLSSCDVSREEDVARLAAAVKDRGGADVLVNNAGYGDYRPTEKMDNTDMRRQFEVNFFGAYYCVKALGPMLRESAGYILNVGSVFSRVALGDNSVYAAAKFALAGYTEGLRREMKPRGVGVGLFLPGPMNTGFQDLKAGGPQPPRALIMEPDRAARAMEAMIRTRARERTLPFFLPWLLRTKAALAA